MREEKGVDELLRGIKDSFVTRESEHNGKTRYSDS